jgi:hypothetical protein
MFPIPLDIDIRSMLEQDLRNADVIPAYCYKKRKPVEVTTSIYVFCMFDGKLLSQAVESEQRRVVQGGGYVQRPGPISLTVLAYVVYFGPCREMRFVTVKEIPSPPAHKKRRPRIVHA